MNLLKRIPLHYKGELHDVRLINFTVPMNEVINKVPDTIKVRNFNGRAMISMVDVKLNNMRPVMTPFLRFSYRHIAFRLLVDDSQYNNGVTKGIYFLKSFTDRFFVAAGGKLLTDYNLELASINEANGTTEVHQGQDRIKYSIDDKMLTQDEALTNTVRALDRAYAAPGGTLRVTQIQREKWPILPTNCTGFENTFFKSTTLVGAFRVLETIHYDWLPPQTLKS